MAAFSHTAIANINCDSAYLRQNLGDSSPVNYVAIARCSALQGMNESALQYLEMATRAGYLDYESLEQATEFSAIKQHERFKSLLATIRELSEERLARVNPDILSLYRQQNNEATSSETENANPLDARKRIGKVLQLYALDAFRTSDDYLYAASIVVAGNEKSDFELALKWAKTAVRMDARNYRAQRLSLFAEDKWRMAEGMPALWGIAFIGKSESLSGAIAIDREAKTDKERIWSGAPTLFELDGENSAKPSENAH